MEGKRKGEREKRRKKNLFVEAEKHLCGPGERKVGVEENACVSWSECFRACPCVCVSAHMCVHVI